MKDLLGRGGITEFFTLVGPGLFLLLSLVLGLPNRTLDKLLAAEVKALDSIAMALLVALIAYTLGQVINALAMQSTRARYSDIIETEKTLYRTTLVRGLTWLLQGTLNSPLDNPDNIEALSALSERVGELTSDSLIPSSAYEVVTAFRVLVAGMIETKWRPLLERVEEVSRRKLFAQGTSVALLILAVPCVVRTPSYPMLAAAAAVAVAASFGLRFAASLFWEQELFYTYRIYMLVTPGAGWTPGA